MKAGCLCPQSSSKLELSFDREECLHLLEIKLAVFNKRKKKSIYASERRLTYFSYCEVLS